MCDVRGVDTIVKQYSRKAGGVEGRGVGGVGEWGVGGWEDIMVNALLAW